MLWPKRRNQDRGQRAEQEAASLLRGQGLRIIDTNYRCRFGEIDIVARSETHLIFVEVRYRNTAHYGGGAASVDFRKQRKLILAARHFLSQGRFNELPCRFDVIEASQGSADKLQLNWISNAFQPE